MAWLGRRRCRGEPVERPEERRQRLARPGRGDDQGVAAAADRVPGALLGRGRRREGALEPGPGGGGEAVERGHSVILPRRSDPRRSVRRRGASPTTSWRTGR